MHQSKFSKEKMFRGILFLILMVFVLSACVITPLGVGDVATWTPSPSATPTCVPNSNPSTPIGWDPASRLIIILFDENSNNGEFLEFANGEKTQSVTDFIVHIIPSIAKSGDQVSVFQLGYRALEYEEARFVRVYSYTETQQLYNTPAPNQTLTPIPIIATPLKGLSQVQATSLAAPIHTAHAATSTALALDDNCRNENWTKSGMLTATSLAQTQAAEVAISNANLKGTATSFVDIAAVKTPYSSDVVYEGLYHASVDLKSDCAKYDKCILIIVDDLNTWTFKNQGDFDIDLTGVDSVYIIMPNCKSINQPSCAKYQDFWNVELEKYEIGQEPVYDNGIRAEQDLLDTIGR